MQIKAFHLSSQGASHIKRDKECQDASYSFCNDEYALTIVCDGHGGDDYVRSAIGAKYACQTARECIGEFLHDVDKNIFMRRGKDREERISRLEASIISAWNTAVSLHYSENPLTDEEKSILSSRASRRYLEEGRIESAYGTTMIAAVLTSDYWFGLQIGDGRCVVVSTGGAFSQPIPWNEKCFLNVTTSICDTDAINNFRHYYSEDLPAAILIGSDGVDDCFSNNMQLYQLYRTVLFSFSTSTFDEAVGELEDYLPRLSLKGSGDDVSIAAILDMDKVCQLKLLEYRAGQSNGADAGRESVVSVQEAPDAADHIDAQEQTEGSTNEQQKQ